MAKQNKSNSHLKDDPRQAIESGEPRITERTRGHALQKGEPAKQSQKRPPGEPEVGEDFESGRQDAV